jgi:hypothetical protein
MLILAFSYVMILTPSRYLKRRTEVSKKLFL